MIDFSAKEVIKTKICMVSKLELPFFVLCFHMYTNTNRSSACLFLVAGYL